MRARTRASRYRDEVERLYKVLDSHLEGREYLVGDKLSYADITAQPWYAPSLLPCKVTAQSFPERKPQS